MAHACAGQSRPEVPGAPGVELPERSAPGKLRLLILTSLFPPAIGGASELFRVLTEAWEQEMSVENVILLTERRKGTPSRQIRGKTLVVRLLPETRRAKRLLDPVIGMWRYALLTAATAWYLRYRRSQLVLIHGRFGRKTFLRLLKLLGAKVAVLLSDHFRSPENLSGCDVVICITESVYERAKSTLSGTCRIHYVPLPLEPPQARGQTISLAETSAPYFLFLGEISQWKGVDVLLEAFAKFRKDHLEYRLLLAGPVCSRALLGTDCPGATFLGEVDHDTALGLIEQAEALVLPSRSEGLPRVCLEAIALGTKVICPPGVPELQRAYPDWIVRGIKVPDVLDKLRQAVKVPFRGYYDIHYHDPRRIGRQIIEICSEVMGV